MSKPKTDSTAEKTKTYSKALKTVTVNTLDAPVPIVFIDAVGNPSASRALGQFLKGETIVSQITEQGLVGTVEIPFHAVEYIEVTESTTSVEEKNPYGCEPSSDGGGGTNPKK